MLLMAEENIQYVPVDTPKGKASGVEPIRVLKGRKSIKCIGHYFGCSHFGEQTQV